MNERDEHLARQAIAYGIAAELIEKRAASVKRASAPSGFTDEDYAGLLKVAGSYNDDWLPEISASSALGVKNPVLGAAMDMGSYMIPGVGTVLSGYDAARNYTNAFSDFKRGNFWGGMGNLGSGVLNTAFAVPVVGGALRGVVKGIGRLFGAGGKAVAKGAKGAWSAAKGTRAGSAVANAVSRAGSAASRAGSAAMGTRAGSAVMNAIRPVAQYAGRAGGWAWRHGKAPLGYMAGFTGTGLMEQYGDAKHKENLMNRSDQADQVARDYWDLMENAPSYNGMHSFNTNSPSYNGSRPLTMHRQPGYGSAFWNQQPSTAY